MLCRFLLAGTSMLAASVSAVHAQSADTQGGSAVAPAPASSTAGTVDETMPEIIVTGSLIRGTPKDAAIPITVVTEKEMQQRGSPTVVEIIKSLPIVGPVIGDSNQHAAGAQNRIGGGTINLRGVGAERTLVLLNGKRFTGYASDTNLLPIAAIGRVEILKDGAAATYGSDAIGGVANFITRAPFNGVEVYGDYRLVPGSRGGDYNFSVNLGRKTDNANFFLSLGYQHRAQLRTVDRDWVVQPYTSNPTGYSVLGNPGLWTLRTGTNGTGAAVGLALDANCSALGGAQTYTGTLPACYFTYMPFENLVEESDQFQAYGEVNTDFGSSKLHVEGMYAQTWVPNFRASPGFPPLSGPNGPGSVNVYTVPSTNPGFATFLTQTGNAGLIGIASSAQATLWRPIANGGNPFTGGLGGARFNRRFQQLRVSADLSGPTGIGDINYSVSGTYIREWQRQGGGGDIVINRLQAALNGLGGPNCAGTTPGANGCQYFNPFSNAIPGNPALGGANPGYVSANANDTALVKWMFEEETISGSQNTFVADAVLNGTLGITLPGGEVAWALGAQYRRIEYEQSLGSPLQDARINPCPTLGSNSCTYPTGPFIFHGQGAPFENSLAVKSIYGELGIPFTPRLNAQISLRHEDYGGLTGSTTNPQFRGKWQVTDWLGLRGSVGTSFRGPTAANRSASGATTLVGIAAAGNNYKSVDFLGNPSVGPEKAFTWDVGVLVKSGGFNASIDYWSYRIKDQITTVPAAIIATAVAGVGNGSQFVNCASPVRDLIVFNNNNACVQGVTVGNDISRVRSPVTNGPTINTSGIDIDLGYRIELGSGTLDLGAQASYILKYKQDAFIYGGATVSPAYSAVGYTNYDRLPGTMPRWRGQFFASYATGPHFLRWTTNYIAGVTDNRGPTTVQTGPSGNCSVANAQAGTAVNCKLTTLGLKLKPFVTHDLSYQIDLGHGLQMTATVFNLFNTAPSLARLEYSYDPYVGNPLGRTYKIGVRKSF